MSFTHEEDLIIHCLGLLYELYSAGLVEKGSIKLDEKGFERYKELKNQDFNLS